METELERIVVRLVGDDASYRGMMTNARTEATTGQAQLTSFTSRIGDLTTQLSGFASSALATIASFKLGGWLAEAKAAYSEQIGAEKQLNNMLIANGRAVGGLFEEYRAFSEEVQRQTGVFDEQVLAMLKQAEAFGLTGAKAKEAVRGMIAMEQAGIPLRGGFRAFVAMAEGDTSLISRSLGAVHGHTLSVYEVQQRLGRIYSVAAQEGQKASTQLKVAWSELMEEFGKSVFEVGKIVTQIKLEFVNFMRSLSPEFKQAVVVVAMVATGLLALKGIIAGVAFAAGLIGSSFLLVLAPLVAVGVGLSMWADSVGGIGKAWEIVKEKALAFWDWIKPVIPIFIALTGPLGAAAVVIYYNWERVKTVLAAVWDVIVAVGTPVIRGLAAVFSWARDIAVGVWEYIRNRAEAMFQWLLPVGRAALGALSAAWGAISDGAQWVWNKVKEGAQYVWDWLTYAWRNIQFTISAVLAALGFDVEDFITQVKKFFEQLRMTFIVAFVMAEFVLNNFGRVWDTAVAGIAYGVEKLSNDFSYFFKTEMPAYFDWLATNWQAVWGNAGEFASGVITSLMSGELPDIAKLAADFSGGLTTLSIPERAEGAVEADLRREWERLGGELVSDFSTFLERRLREVFGPEGSEPMTTGGATRGGTERAEAKRDLSKVEAVLYSGAEAAARVQAQVFRFGAPQRTQEQNIAAIAGNTANMYAVLAQWLPRLAGTPLTVVGAGL